MRHTISMILFVALFALAPTVLSATPLLQLDIEDGTYIGGSEESTMTSVRKFTLRALLTPGTDTFWLDEDFLLSIAVVPKLPEPGLPSAGSFTIDGGDPINVTSGMVWGTPPLSEMYKDMPNHDVYETYYKQVTVRFEGGNTYQVDEYNVKDSAGATLTPGGTGTYVTEIELDFGGISNSTLDFHFDLYHTTTDPKPRVDAFAPFSHDAETSFNGLPDPISTPVPEPASLVMWGLSLFAAGGLVRLRRKDTRPLLK